MSGWRVTCQKVNAVKQVGQSVVNTSNRKDECRLSRTLFCCTVLELVRDVLWPSTRVFLRSTSLGHGELWFVVEEYSSRWWLFDVLCIQGENVSFMRPTSLIRLQIAGYRRLWSAYTYQSFLHL